MTIDVSVIICTHNPRRDYLRRVLDALRAQTLSKDQWELLVIDNASEREVATEWDLSWHPLARHVREDELGLTPARLRGIAEARGELLTFVDDDNVIDQDYLQSAIDIGRDYPFLGAWGGTVRGEFEVEPESWMRPLLEYLAIREFSTPVWSNNPEDWRAQPYGAGLCVRRSVATLYLEELVDNPARRNLDRVGSELFSGGDSDLVWTSCDRGQGFGNFPRLRLTHLIPKHRVQLKYLIRLTKGIVASSILLRYTHFGALPPQPSILHVGLGFALTWARRGRRQAWIYKATKDAAREAIRLARDLRESQTGASLEEAMRIGEPKLLAKDAAADRD